METADLVPEIPAEVWSDRLQEIVTGKDTDKAIGGEGWAIINDEILVVHQFDHPPEWLRIILDTRDEDGNLPIAVIRKLEELAVDAATGKYDLEP